jgi:hypothetical protein
MEKIPLAQAYKGASSNFYTIAAFSLINSIIAAFQGGLHFVIGLGITQLIDAFAYVFGKNVPDLKLAFMIISGSLDLLVCGVIALFGFLASRSHNWAIVTGMALYALDAMLMLFFNDWIGFAFHLYFLWRIWMNWQVIRLWKKAEKNALDAFPQNIGSS